MSHKYLQSAHIEHSTSALQEAGFARGCRFHQVHAGSKRGWLANDCSEVPAADNQAIDLNRTLPASVWEDKPKGCAGITWIAISYTPASLGMNVILYTQPSAVTVPEVTSRSWVMAELETTLTSKSSLHV